VPGDAPRDIDLEVAALVQSELQRIASRAEMELDSANAIAKHDRAVFWLHALGGVVPRSLTKRPVMILPYGGTREAYFKYTMKWLEENDPQGVKFPEERRWKLARFITNVMWAIVRKKLEKAVKVQKWLEENAKPVAQITTAPWR
jgi:DNA-directed RNA polymerase